MYLIVGLGNPGLQYSATKHNIGFEVIARLAHEYGVKLKKSKHQALVAQSTGDSKFVLVQPQTYMNLSGVSVRSLADFYKVPHDRIIIAFDDTSLDIGQIRIKTKGSAGGHNGIKSIISHLGSNEFPRVKIGIGNKPPGWDLADFVMSRFTKEETSIIVPTIKKACEAIEVIMKYDINKAMNLYNIKQK